MFSQQFSSSTTQGQGVEKPVMNLGGKNLGNTFRFKTGLRLPFRQIMLWHSQHAPYNHNKMTKSETRGMQPSCLFQVHDRARAALLEKSLQSVRAGENKPGLHWNVICIRCGFSYRGFIGQSGLGIIISPSGQQNRSITILDSGLLVGWARTNNFNYKIKFKTSVT